MVRVLMSSIYLFNYHKRDLVVLNYSIWEFQREETTDIKELFNVLEEVKTGQKTQTKPKKTFISQKEKLDRCSPD